MLNQQEIFDKVARHLLTQMVKAGDDGNCFYHTKEGLSCAIGCLIPLDQYTPKIEGKNIRAVFNKHYRVFDGVLSTIDPAIFTLLFYLQHVHDDFVPQHWEEELHRVAQELNLFPPKISGFQPPVKAPRQPS